MRLLEKLCEVLEGLFGKIRAVWIKIGALRENCLEGIEDQYSEWIEDQHSLKAPFSTQLHFLPKNPFSKSIFPKRSIFDPNAPFLPPNTFRTLIFLKIHFRPKRVEFYPKIPSGHQSSLQAPFSTQMPPFFAKNSLQDINFLLVMRKPIFPETSSIYTWSFRKLFFLESRISTSQSSISTQKTL